MKNSIIELSHCELNSVFGGGRHDYDDITIKQALFVALATVATMIISVYIFDPISHSIQRYFKNM